MQVIETLAEGLKREIKVVIPAKDMEAQMNERLEGVKDRVRINGFRPGKVPFAQSRRCMASRSWPNSSTRSSAFVRTKS